MKIQLADAIFLAGIGQLGVLFASALVPFQLNWKEAYAPLPKLHRQLVWVYGGYIVLSILSLGLICLFCSRELASGSTLARAFSVYGMVFWGIRLTLQGVFDVQQHLTNRWLHLGYHSLTLVFVGVTVIYAWAAFHPAA